jgi:hypothetical protein
MAAMIRLLLLALPLLLTPALREGWARDGGADGQFSQRRSTHFVLYQDVAIDHYSGPSGTRQFEREVLGILEDAYDRVVTLLGVRPLRPVEVVVYDPGVFDARYRNLFSFRAAGFYAGLIRIRGDSRISTGLVRTLEHEYVHAALDAAAPRIVLPAWLNEGLAEWAEARAIEKRRLSRGEAALLVESLEQGTLPSLASLSGPSFGNLGPEQASLAYLKSYAMIEYLARQHGEPLLRRLVGHVVRTGNVPRAFVRTYRRSPEEIETGLHAELR